MKKLAVGFALLCAVAQLHAADWLTDVPKAVEKAKAEKKHVMLHFTGSDWCPPCKALHANVLTTKEFETYADKNLILVDIDFPHNIAQSDELKKTNKALGDKYKLKGVPTVVILDGDGKQVGEAIVGYSKETPGDYIKKLDTLLKK
jgi:thioredoxin-related protein